MKHYTLTLLFFFALSCGEKSTPATPPIRMSPDASANFDALPQYQDTEEGDTNPFVSDKDVGEDASDQGVHADAPDAANADMGNTSDMTPTDFSHFCNAIEAPNELIADRRFRRGFTVLDKTTAQPAGPIAPDFCPGKEPIWSLAQWGSLGDLSTQTNQIAANQTQKWENAYGHIQMGRISGPDADLRMAVWAYQEYGGQYHIPTLDRVWVHLLAEQRISPPGVMREGCPPLSSLSELNFKLGARLVKDIPHRQNGYKRGKHAAQFLIYFTVQNLNPASMGFGDYLWFGITPYDDRTPITGTYINGDQLGDIGTGKLIYNLGAQPFGLRALNSNQPEQIFSRDILPDVRLALLEAWQRGYLRDSNVLSDYRIGGMNLGWEVPGLNDVDIQIRDLSLRFKEKATAKTTYDFNRDGNQEGWTSQGVISSGPSQGQWTLQVPGDNPTLTSPPLTLDADQHQIITIVFANDHNPSDTSIMQIFWERFGEKGFREAWSVSLPVSNGGGWQTLNIDMGSNPNWKGEISKIRIDPITAGDGHSVAFDSIAF